MKRSFQSVAIAAAAVLAGFSASAQQRADESQATRSAWQDSLAYDDYLGGRALKASELIGARVENERGESLGQVKDLIVSRADDVVEAVIAVGGVLGIGEKEIGVPYERLRVSSDGDTLFLSMTREQLEAQPAYDPERGGQTAGRSAASGAAAAAAATQAAAQQRQRERAAECVAERAADCVGQAAQQPAGQRPQAGAQQPQQPAQQPQQAAQAARQAQQAEQQARQAEQQARQAEQQARQAEQPASRAQQQAEQAQRAQQQQQQAQQRQAAQAQTQQRAQQETEQARQAQQQAQQETGQARQAQQQAQQETEQARQAQERAQQETEQARQAQQQQAEQRQAEQAQARQQQAERRPGQTPQASRQTEAPERGGPAAPVEVMDRADHRATELIGTAVVDTEGQEVGEIDDLVVSPADGRIHAVLAVGGVLGVGERLVSVPLEALEIEPEAADGEARDGEPTVRLRMTSEELESRPQFRYDDEERTAGVR